VRDTSPADFATGVAPGAPITVTMSRDLDPSTVLIGQTVRLVGGITGREVAATATYDVDTATVVVTPSAPLRAGLPYVLRLRNVEASDGTLLDELQRFRFTIAG
jgi:hypothetical protein